MMVLYKYASITFFLEEPSIQGKLASDPEKEVFLRRNGCG